MTTRYATRTAVAPRPATDKQRDFLRSLLAGVGEATDAADNAELTTRQASAMIDDLKGRAPVQKPGADVGADVAPAGRYAVTFGGKLTPFLVDRPTTGRWAGWVFVKEIIGDTDKRLSRADGKGVLAAIALAGPKNASVAYGRAVGRCGLCNRTLTDPASVEAGIGPDCAKKF